MKKFVMFTRHQMTDEQLAEPNEAYIASVYAGEKPLWATYAELASKVITTQVEAMEIASVILSGAGPQDDVEIYGVLPAPIRAMLESLLGEGGGSFQRVTVWEAWNVNRAPEGQKPQFEFKGWLLTQRWNY